MGIVDRKVGHRTVTLARWVSINVSVLADARNTSLLDQVVDHDVAAWEDRREVLVLAIFVYVSIVPPKSCGRSSDF